MNYFFLFLIVFVPLVSHKWSRTRSTAATPFSFSFTRTQRTPPGPSPTLHRVMSSMRKPPRPPPPPPPQYTYSPPPSAYIPKSPSVFERWFSSPAKMRKPPPVASKPSFARSPVSPYAAARNAEGIITLTAFLGTEGSNVDVDMVVLLTHVQAACKHIASLLASPTDLQAWASESDVGGGRDSSKSLNVISNNILKAALRSSGKVAAIASEEDDEPTWFGEGPYVVVFDPLDGSDSVDAFTPTGTILGIYLRLPEADHLALREKAAINTLQRGERLVAAGYTLYSSATMLSVSVGSGLHGFTLDREIGEFVLTHPDIRVPERGQIYSVNDARYFDWPPALRRYIDTIRQGKGQNPRRYSSRYICSMVADLHRTILYGGIAMNPRPNLHLVYEANPLSYLVEHGGGKCSDGRQRILEVQPAQLYHRVPLFLGSRADVSELEGYGDVQQVVNSDDED